jgi:hypothetical protein
MGGARRPSPVDLPRPVHRRRRSRDRLRRLSSHTGTDRVRGGGTGGFGRGTDGRVRTGTNEQPEPVVTAGRRGQENGQLVIGRVVPEAASRGYEYLAIRQPAARNIGTIRECYGAGFRTRPGFRLRYDAQRQPVAAGGRSWMRLHRAEWMFCEFRAVSSHCEGQPPHSAIWRTYAVEARPFCSRCVGDGVPTWLSRATAS